jgi:hypothetical protein
MEAPHLALRGDGAVLDVVLGRDLKVDSLVARRAVLEQDHVEVLYRTAGHTSLKPIGSTWSYLACKTGHVVPIWKPRIGSSLQ